MIAPLDVFAVHDSESKWLGCAQTLVEALELIRSAGPGEYFVFSQTTEHTAFYKVGLHGDVSLEAAP
jgi:hypothetical protein